MSELHFPVMSRIFVFGDGAEVTSYSTETQSWTVLQPMTDIRSYATAATLGFGSDGDAVVTAMRTVLALTHFPPGLLPLISSFLGPDWIVVAGGQWSDARVTVTTLWYSLDTRSWRSHNVPSMWIGRFASTCVAVGGRMMVFGGRDMVIDRQHLCYLVSCEAFDLVTNEWSPLPPMSTPRAYACAAAWRGRSFVFGGWNSGLCGLASAECFDSKMNRWSFIPSMSTARYSAAAVAVAGGIIVMGGYGKYGDQLQSAELYDPTCNQWTTMTWQLPTPLASFAAHCIDGVLHVIGHKECWSMDLGAAVPVWLPLPPREGRVMASVTV